MKTNSKKMIKLSIILYGVLLCVILVSTLAWFVFDKTAGIESAEDMTITAGNNLEISLDGENWDQKQTPTVSQNCPDITGDGINFYYPQTLDEADNPFLSDKDSFIYVNEHEDSDKFYIDVKLHFRTSGNSSVYLLATSSIIGANLNLDDAMGIHDGFVPNDAIAGALRVAFYDITDKGEGEQPTETDLKCIWIPNDSYKVYTVEETTTDEEGNTRTVPKLAFTENGEREAEYGYLALNNDKTEYEFVPWSIEDYTSGKVVVGNGGLATNSSTGDGTEYPMINNAVPLLDFGDANGLTEKTMLIRIWTEGTDREANTYLNSGEVKYKFDFISIEKQEPTSDAVTKLQGIKYVDNQLVYADNTAVQAGEVIYSLNGIDWNVYAPRAEGFAAGKIYIKTIETAGTKSSTYTHEIEISSS